MIRFLVLALLLALPARAASLDVLYPNTATFVVAGTSSDLTSVAYSFDAFGTAGVACTGTYSWRCTITNATGTRTLSIRATGAAGTTTKTITLYGPTWLLDVDSRGSGVERVSSPTLDATGATVVLACNAKDYSGTTLTCDTGGALSKVEVGADATGGLRAPVTGSDNGAITYAAADYHQAASAATGDVTTEDTALFAVFRLGTAAGYMINHYSAAATSGWLLFQSNATSVTLYIDDGPDSAQVNVSTSLVANTWYTVACFRDDASTVGLQCFMNGTSAVSGANPQAVDNITSTAKVTVGADAAGGNPWSGDIAYFEMRTCATCINQADFATIAKEWTASYAGILPSVAAGTDEPSTMTRATVAMLDIDNGTSTQLFTVGSGWPRVVARKTPQEAVVREGFLSEPQSTNLALQVQTFDNASWVTFGTNTISANAIAAPDGATTADGFIADGNTGGHVRKQAVTLTAAAYTMSVYAKQGNQPSILLFEGIGGKGVCFNLNTGVVIGNYNGTTPTASALESLGGGWYRASMTWTATAVSTEINYIPSDDVDSCASGDQDFVGDSATVNTYLWNAQVEAQPVATSPILTTTASVTRNGDNFQYSGTTNDPATAGLAQIDMTMPNSGYGTVQEMVSLGTTTASNLRQLYTSTFTTFASFNNAQAPTASLTGTVDPTSGRRFAGRGLWATNDFSFHENGVQAGSDSAGDAPTTATTIFLGQSRANNSQPVAGYIQRFFLRSQTCNPAVCP